MCQEEEKEAPLNAQGLRSAARGVCNQRDVRQELSWLGMCDSLSLTSYASGHPSAKLQGEVACCVGMRRYAPCPNAPKKGRGSWRCSQTTSWHVPRRFARPSGFPHVTPSRLAPLVASAESDMPVTS